jgi:lipopolysaccharide/colanic/teichoic acid biosynthesis glycosyltransferase
MKVLLKTKILLLHINDGVSDMQSHSGSYFERIALQWRKGRLWVTHHDYDAIEIPALKSKQWLEDCLQRSNVKGVYLDLNLNDEYLRAWADACAVAKKAAFLRLASSLRLPRYYYSLSWYIKRILDWWMAVLLLLALGPIMLTLMVLVKATSPGPIFFRQWRVGQRGKLFKIFKFRTMVENAETLHHSVMRDQQGLHKCQHDPRITPLGRFMRKYSLDELPQLLNVVRGEMSLVGPRPWALYDAIRIRPKDQHRLKALPGITGAWQVAGRSHILELDMATRFDLEYLKSWSLWQDARILLMTIPKVFSGFGAY